MHYLLICLIGGVLLVGILGLTLALDNLVMTTKVPLYVRVGNQITTGILFLLVVPMCHGLGTSFISVLQYFHILAME